MSEPLKIVSLPQPDLMNVPASLRRLADQMEIGEMMGAVRALVVAVDANGELSIFGYGEVGDRASEVGLLYMAAIEMATL
jgi:hypothetical protein